MKTPVNLTKKKVWLHIERTHHVRETDSELTPWHIIIQLLNIKENWSPLAFRQKISDFSREISASHQQFHRKEEQLSPSLCLPQTGPSRPLALSSGSPASVWRTDGSKFKTEKKFFRIMQLLCYGVSCSHRWFCKPRHLSVSTGPSPTRRQPSEETFSDQSPKSETSWERPEFSPEINMQVSEHQDQPKSESDITCQVFTNPLTRQTQEKGLHMRLETAPDKKRPIVPSFSKSFKNLKISPALRRELFIPEVYEVFRQV